MRINGFLGKNMLCAIYKSNKKQGAYLYIKQKDKFDTVPPALLNQFGVPQFVMVLNLAKRNALAGADIIKVRASLEKEDFFLQLPPPLDATLSHIRSQNTKLV